MQDENERPSIEHLITLGPDEEGNFAKTSKYGDRRRHNSFAVEETGVLSTKAQQEIVEIGTSYKMRQKKKKTTRTFFRLVIKYTRARFHFPTHVESGLKSDFRESKYHVQ